MSGATMVINRRVRVLRANGLHAGASITVIRSPILAAACRVARSRSTALISMPAMGAPATSV